MLRRTLLAGTIVLICLPAAGARRGPTTLMQSPVTERGWILSIDNRRARVTAPDGVRRSFRVRKHERWIDFAEAPNGWVAAGVMPLKDGLELALVADFGGGPRRLDLPGAGEAKLQTAPRPLIGSDGLAGMVWLEGDDFRQLSVMAADFDGHFAQPVVVSSPGRGSQTGLTAAVLADGSWLLAWSRFDGNDDEIYWSRRAPAGEWSQPRRLAANNSIPDITPHLVPHGDGALVAWSRRVSDYEVFTSQFSSSGWSTPRPLGAAGMVKPRFQHAAADDYLVVRNAWPAGWTAYRLDATGHPVDFASVAADSAERPVLRSRPGAGLVFEWGSSRRTEGLRWEPAQ